MIRKFLLPALLVGLLGGCVTGYGYRDGYYYGQPSVQYRYYDYGYPYGYYPYYGGYGGYGGYGYYPYGERYRYYNNQYPYYRYPYYPRQQRPQTPAPGTQPGNVGGGEALPPWRDYARRRRNFEGTPGDARPMTREPSQPMLREAPRREARNDGSRMQPAIRRAQEPRRRSSEQEP